MYVNNRHYDNSWNFFFLTNIDNFVLSDLREYFVAVWYLPNTFWNTHLCINLVSRDETITCLSHKQKNKRKQKKSRKNLLNKNLQSSKAGLRGRFHCLYLMRNYGTLKGLFHFRISVNWFLCWHLQIWLIYVDKLSRKNNNQLDGINQRWIGLIYSNLICR